jgi:hypothetical protein
VAGEQNFPPYKLAEVAALIPYARNSRTHSDEQVAQIAASIKEFGFTNPVLVDGDNGIIAGHGRVLAARKLGMDTVPVVELSHLSDAQKRAYIIADNKLALNAGWDDEMLALEFAELQELGFDLDLTGFDAEAVEALVGLDESEGDDAPGASPAAPAGSLSDRFMIPPFSVLNAREGWWQNRKRWWLGLGIRSELGRGEGDQHAEKAANGKRKAATFGQDLMRGEHELGSKSTGGVLMAAPSAADPGFYEKKRAAEKKLGRELSTAEFLADHYVPPEGSTVAATGTSIFDPVLCELVYRWFSPPDGVVLDPFAGGSVRGIVAAKLGRQYIGHELRGEQVAANRAQADEICADDEHPPAWIEGDSRMIDRTCADVGADFVFSCPPYADLEVYSDDPADLSTLGYEAFRDAYFEIIAKACARLRDNRFACFVVGEVRDKHGNYYDFVGDTVEAFRRAGLHYYNEAILVTAVGSLPIRAGKQFAASRKLGKTHQNVLVFVKGDAKKAVAACGEVEVPEEALDRASADGDPAGEFGEVMA